MSSRIREQIIKDIYTPMRYRWALRGLSKKSEGDKRAIANAESGHGYVIVSRPDQNQKHYVVGIQVFDGNPLPTGAEWANKHQSEKLDKMFRKQCVLDKIDNSENRMKNESKFRNYKAEIDKIFK